MVIEKKIDKSSFDLILKGVKKYEIRLDEFECKEGDVLVLKEKDPKTEKLTGREVRKKVTFVFKIDLNNYHWPKEEILQKGLQVISLT